MMSWFIYKRPLDSISPLRVWFFWTFQRVGTESVTFLSNQENNGMLYSIPGLWMIMWLSLCQCNTLGQCCNVHRIWIALVESAARFSFSVCLSLSVCLSVCPALCPVLSLASNYTIVLIIAKLCRVVSGAESSPLAWIWTPVSQLKLLLG